MCRILFIMFKLTLIIVMPVSSLLAQVEIQVFGSFQIPVPSFGASFNHVDEKVVDSDFDGVIDLFDLEAAT